MIYHDWGFTGSPFQTTSLPPSEAGKKLLVGRDRELSSLKRKIGAAPKMATLEGLNGVGKTSIVNVAAYDLYKESVASGRIPFYLPCRTIFQLNAQQDADSFIDAALMEIAQTLIDRARELQQAGPRIETGPVNKWLNSPQLSSPQAGAWTLQFGLQRETNTSNGFERSGFRKIITSWLEELFPTLDSGGIICTIDNLELLQSSDIARAQLEKLRDQLLTISGLRWVLCGALGIVYGVVGSPRLEGYLHAPILIKEMDIRLAEEILQSRIQAFSADANESYLPLVEADFATLFSVLRGNLRSVLSYSEDYCQWIAGQDELPQTNDKKRILFTKWLDEQGQDAYESVRQELRPRVQQVFSKAIEIGGIFSPSDFESFGFNSIAAFRPSIRDLESVGVLVSTQDDGDKRRKTIQITPKGWLVSKYQQSK